MITTNPNLREKQRKWLPIERGNSNRFTDLDENKLRGGYYTSIELAEWLCSWAIRTSDDLILEPSCGDGAFLEAIINRLFEFGVKGKEAINASQLFGIEILASEADKARSRVNRQLGFHANKMIETKDFFEWWIHTDRPLVDVAIGNPPFIRYQSFPEPHRTRAMDIMKNLGFSPNRLTNIWVPFVAASAACLRPGGRLAFILPAELLQVSYASQLRAFLTDHFDRINLIACNELFFENAEQEVVLLLAEKAKNLPIKKSSCKVVLVETKTVNQILSCSHKKLLKGASPKIVNNQNEKWLKYFLTSSEIEFMRELRVSSVVTTIDTFASVNVGVVTGKNQFFVLTRSQVQKLGLENYISPLVSRSAHLKGVQISQSDWEALANADDLVHLLDLSAINGSKLPSSLENYIRLGELQKVHQGYKCSIRDPWYSVPSVWIPDGFFFRQIYDFPRVVINKTEATSTDTIHRMKCKDVPHKVIANLYTHLTAASAEIEGRSYGGGVLELEPSEAVRLLMPSKLAPALSLNECDKLVRDGRLDDVLAENDRLILIEQMGLSHKECQMLHNIWKKMRDRRLSRRKRGHTHTA